jgi:RNA recognition motif-containing protein
MSLPYRALFVKNLRLVICHRHVRNTANLCAASTSLRRSSSISLANLARCGMSTLHALALVYWLTFYSQIRQGIANNTKGTAFVVYEDVMDAKSACDKLNGFNFQNRYLVGMWIAPVTGHNTDDRSIIPPARQDDQGSKRSRRAPGELRKAQETARYRLA